MSACAAAAHLCRRGGRRSPCAGDPGRAVPAGPTPEAWHLFAALAAAIRGVVTNAFRPSPRAPAAAASWTTARPRPPRSSRLATRKVLLGGQPSSSRSGGMHATASAPRRGAGRPRSGSPTASSSPTRSSRPRSPATRRGAAALPPSSPLAAGRVRREDPAGRRTGGFLMFSGMASLAVSSALWLTATSANPIGASVAAHMGVRIDFGSWLLASCVPALATIASLPLFLYRLYPPRRAGHAEAPAAARRELAAMGPLSRDERIVAAAFVLMVAGWVLGPRLGSTGPRWRPRGLGGLLASGCSRSPTWPARAAPS